MSERYHYQRQPWSQEQRDRLSKTQIQRLGSPPGYRKMYGSIVPEKIKEITQKAVYDLAQRDGRAKAEQVAALLRTATEARAQQWVDDYFANRVLGKTGPKGPTGQRKPKLIAEPKKEKNWSGLTDKDFNQFLNEMGFPTRNSRPPLPERVNEHAYASRDVPAE